MTHRPAQPRPLQALVLERLEAMYARVDDRGRRRWRRSQPLAEAVFDRWRRAQRLGFGAKASIYHQSYVYGDVTVGDNTWIGPYTLLDGSGGLHIGNWCSISAGAQVYTHSTERWAVTAGTAPYEHGSVRIGDRCFIGPLTVVAAGLDIGEACIVGAHSYVNRSLPPGVIAVGAPARVIGKVEDWLADGEPKTGR
jgi:acetyltransferase-like isoleucine patch superfamily enzyme